MNFAIDVSASILRESLAGPFIDNTIIDEETVDDVVPTTMDHFVEVPNSIPQLGPAQPIMRPRSSNITCSILTCPISTTSRSRNCAAILVTSRFAHTIYLLDQENTNTSRRVAAEFGDPKDGQI